MIPRPFYLNVRLLVLIALIGSGFHPVARAMSASRLEAGPLRSPLLGRTNRRLPAQPMLPSSSARQRLSSSAPRVPLILLPGLTGSRLENDPDGDGRYSEVWPNGDRLILDPWDRSLLQLKLAPDGANPYRPELPYATVRVGDIIRSEYFLDYYASTIRFFTARGYVEGENFFVCPYDWRKDLEALAHGPLANTLEGCIDRALAENPGAGQVDLLAHSMGGLVARAYLADPARAPKVRRLVTLGTPLLGAPKMALAILDELCFAEWLGLCFTNASVLHELIQDYPAGYEIAPGASYFQVYPHGFVRRQRDADGDGRPDGFLAFPVLQKLFAAHNPALAERARTLADQLGPWSSADRQGVEVFAVVGDGHAAIGTLVEYERRPWLDPWGQAEIAYRAQPVNGDGTVPLRSADLQNRARGVDLTGGVPVFYFHLEHGALPKDPSVLDLAAEIFANAGPVQSDALLARSAVTGGTPPRTLPQPMDGYWLEVEGPVEVEARDAAGRALARHAAAPPGLGPAAPILPGAVYTAAGEAAYLFLPGPASYEIRLRGQAAGSAAVRLETLQGDTVTATHRYAGLPVSDGSLAVLIVDPAAGGPGEFALDRDNDGKPEAVYPPAAVLDARSSLDVDPPVVSASVQGGLTLDGHYAGPVIVTLSASDGPEGAGVERIDYSPDGGATTQAYLVPFTVDPAVTAVILARAIDRAGNESSPATVRLVPARLFLPVAFNR